MRPCSHCKASNKQLQSCCVRVNLDMESQLQNLNCALEIGACLFDTKKSLRLWHSFHRVRKLPSRRLAVGCISPTLETFRFRILCSCILPQAQREAKSFFGESAKSLLGKPRGLKQSCTGCTCTRSCMTWRNKAQLSNPEKWIFIT